MATVVSPFILATAKPNPMTDDTRDRSYTNNLYPEDQKKVDEFVSRGINSVERKPFKPLRLVLMLVAVVTTLSIFSQFLARWAGVY